MECERVEFKFKFTIEVDGAWREIHLKRPTRSPLHFMCTYNDMSRGNRARFLRIACQVLGIVLPIDQMFLLIESHRKTICGLSHHAI